MWHVCHHPQSSLAAVNVHSEALGTASLALLHHRLTPPGDTLGWPHFCGRVSEQTRAEKESDGLGPLCQRVTNSCCGPGADPQSCSSAKMGPGFPTQTLWLQKSQTKGFAGFTCNAPMTLKAFVTHLTSTEEKCNEELNI